MSSVDSFRYADWKAPDEDGQLLVWPDADQVLADTRANQARLARAEARVQGVPLGELRRRVRGWIGHKDDARPLVGTGHQAELYHPGVWVKDALINAAARGLGGDAYHFGVDTDSPKHLHLRWPGGSMGLTDDERLTSAAWTGLLDGPTPAHVDALTAAFEEGRLGWGFEPMVEPFLADLKRLSIERPPLAELLTNALHRLDWELGLRHHAMLTSPLLGSREYLVFVHHVLARAGEFAGQYNGALAAYRAGAGITSPGRPMPDLQAAGDAVEAPFWLDDVAAGARARLTVTRATGVGGAWALRGFEFDPATPGDDAAERLGRFLRENNLRVAPRALTLTMFLRLFVCDQFVHGIGGGRYDQVTDRVISGHFGVEPPRFAVTTATLYFPAARGQRRISLRPLLQEGRRLRHGSFSREKREQAARIAALPRRSRERRELFGQMHQRLAQQAQNPVMVEWARRLDEATREQMRQKALFDRELFFAIQPEERLREMIGRYDDLFA